MDSASAPIRLKVAMARMHVSRSISATVAPLDIESYRK
ncbi:hypothetical protein MGWOODY_Smn2637 [hydrothermal vent metagenome]|uniref:Uncharacterized protein n=1 Tax=hydrothermal vent metagenome TaxID=652676 RepID=A0A161KFI9_9ZZZZ